MLHFYIKTNYFLPRENSPCANVIINEKFNTVALYQKKSVKCIDQSYFLHENINLLSRENSLCAIAVMNKNKFNTLELNQKQIYQMYRSIISFTLVNKEIMYRISTITTTLRTNRSALLFNNKNNNNHNSNKIIVVFLVLNQCLHVY